MNSTVAGNGISGSIGDDGAATSAELNNPTALVLDCAGNLYIADNDNMVRRVDTVTGLISTVVGSLGTSGNAGTGNQATEAKLVSPQGLVEPGYHYRVTRGSPALHAETYSALLRTISLLLLTNKAVNATGSSTLMLFEDRPIRIGRDTMSTTLVNAEDVLRTDHRMSSVRFIGAKTFVLSTPTRIADHRGCNRTPPRLFPTNRLPLREVIGCDSRKCIGKRVWVPVEPGCVCGRKSKFPCA